MKSKKIIFKSILLLIFCLCGVFAVAQRPQVELSMTQPSPNLNIRIIRDKYHIISGQEYTIIIQNLSNKNIHVKGQLVAVLLCGNEVSTKFDQVLKPSEKMGGHAYLFDASGMTGIVYPEDCKNCETVLDDEGKKRYNRIKTIQLRSYSSVIEKTDEEKAEEQRQQQMATERKQQEEASKQAAANQQIKLQQDARIQQQNAYNQKQEQLRAQMQLIHQNQEAQQQKYDAINGAISDATNEIVDYLKKKQAKNEQQLAQQQAEREQREVQAEMDRLKKDEDQKIEAEQERQAERLNKEKDEDRKQVETAEKPTNVQLEEQLFAALKGKPGVGALPDGVHYIVIKAGTGVRPTVKDSVVINAIGVFPDGTVFEDTFQKKKEITTLTSALIPGLNEAIQLMPEGSVWRIFVPSALAYGPAGLANIIPSNSALVFDITLIEVKIHRTLIKKGNQI